MIETITLQIYYKPSHSYYQVTATTKWLLGAFVGFRETSTLADLI